ncbi:MAG: hypothetical protein K2J58_02790, partial [Muribaculaceae bacterium]|nr:hypothetical protein [Muribaculaceae bacterium]
MISIAMAVLSLFSCLFVHGAATRTGRLFNDPVVMAGDYTGFCQDKDGYVWIGSDRGLFRFDGNSYDIYRHDDAENGSVSDSRILGVMCDSKGRVWVATANGLNLYMPDSDTFKVVRLPLQNEFFGYVIGMGEQIDGTVTFVVSGVGLYLVDDASGEPVAVMYPG